jgi:hypothetical protein
MRVELVRELLGDERIVAAAERHVVSGDEYPEDLLETCTDCGVGTVESALGERDGARR